MKIYHFLPVVAAIILMPAQAHAQSHHHIHSSYQTAAFDAPYPIDSVSHLDFSDNGRQLQIHLVNSTVTPNFNIGATDSHILSTDSISFEDEPLIESKDRHDVFQLFVNTIDQRPVSSKTDYVECYIALNACEAFSNYAAPARIRGRGNSSWEWYPKKPYRIKLDTKHKILGLDKAKSWVLLANYRDITDMMNTFVFEAAEWMQLPFTNHTRYVELFLNGEYLGVYQLTEQVQQGKNRVNVSDDKGILLALDVDDGPSVSPEANDNFWSSVYRLPACVKYPEDERLNDFVRDSVQEVFAQLEQAVQNADYQAFDSLIDVSSFIRYLILQEFVYNVELDAPRSIFLHKDGDNKWVMGPVWDFDAGYDFDWSNMYTGHTFFSSYRETVMGSNPYRRNGNYPSVSRFFTDMFRSPEFVRQYKEEWNLIKDSLVERNWQQAQRYAQRLQQGAFQREAQRWPLSKDVSTEMNAMHQWLLNRLTFFDNLVNNIPEPEEQVPIHDETLAGTINLDVSIDWLQGYHQANQVQVPKQRLCQLLGIDEDDFRADKVDILPLDNQGQTGPNLTNGVFGAWFDQDGNPGEYAWGHVFIEVLEENGTVDVLNWNCGLYQDNCQDSEHTVTMQMRYQVDDVLKKVNVVVRFDISNAGGGGWWWGW